MIMSDSVISTNMHIEWQNTIQLSSLLATFSLLQISLVATPSDVMGGVVIDHPQNVFF